MEGSHNIVGLPDANLHGARELQLQWLWSRGRTINDDFSKQQKVAWHEALEYTFDEGIEAETQRVCYGIGRILGLATS
jgi:hypothetical protein